MAFLSSRFIPIWEHKKNISAMQIRRAVLGGQDDVPFGIEKERLFLSRPALAHVLLGLDPIGCSQAAFGAVPSRKDRTDVAIGFGAVRE